MYELYCLWVWLKSLCCTYNRALLLLTLGVNAQRGLYTVVGSWVCPSVCLSVTMFSVTTRNETANQRYQRVYCYTGFFLKTDDYCITTAFKSCGMKSKWKANMLISRFTSTGPLALRTLEPQEVTTNGVYRLPHTIYTVASPCQSLRELLVGDHE